MKRKKIILPFNQKLFGCLIFCLATFLGLALGPVIFSNGMTTNQPSNHIGQRSNKILSEIREDIIAGKTFPDSRVESIKTTTPGVEEYRIPNIIHYVILTRNVRPFEFTDFVSVLSALRNQKPREIWMHCNRDPVGQWWDELTRNASRYRLRVVHVDIPVTIGGIAVGNLDHATDIAKTRILLEHGGIYLDTDAIVIQSMDPLRVYSAVFGQETAMRLSPAVVLAEKNSSFLRLLLEAYHEDYRPTDPDYNNGIIPYKLTRLHSNLVFVEVRELVGPGLPKRHLLFSDNQALLDWHRFYAVHFGFHGSEGKIYSPTYIKPLRSIVGRILKYAYYGSEYGIHPYSTDMLAVN